MKYALFLQNIIIGILKIEVGVYMFQKRLNELNSGIIDIRDDKIFVTGFYNADRLNSYLNLQIDNHSSKGVYPKIEFNFNNIKDDALFIVQENGVEKEKVQLKVISKQLMQPLGRNNKIIVTLRQNPFNHKFNLIADSSSLIFDSIEELKSHIQDYYKTPYEVLLNSLLSEEGL